MCVSKNSNFRFRSLSLGGFSVLEIIVGLAIISIFVMGMESNLRSLSTFRILKNESEEIVQMINKSILLCLREEIHSKIEKNGNIISFYKDEDKNQRSSKLIYTYKINSKVIVAHKTAKEDDTGNIPINFGNNSFFKCSKSGVTSPKAYTLKLNDKHCKITVSLRGRVRNEC